MPPNLSLHLTGAVRLVSLGTKVLQAAPAGELCPSAYPYTDKHVGRPERAGNKGGTLGNRLRAVMAGKK